MLLPAPGSWTWHYSVYAEDGTHAFLRGADGLPFPMEVEDRAGVQVFDADIDAAALERAARALEEARAADR